VKAFDWAEFLRSDSCLAIQDEKTRRWLVSDQASSEHTYEPGALIIRKGEGGDSIFVIGSGSVEVLLSVNGEPEILLSVIQRGETFGEMGFFERRPRSATVRAREACVVLEVKGEALRRLADTHPEIGLRLLLRLSERLRRMNEQMHTLHLNSVEAANRAKDEFVAMLGHELRNPLGAIATAIHVLDARSGPDDTSASLRGIIARQTHQLSRLVDGLLEVSKLVSGQIVLTTQPEYLRDVVMRALTSFHEEGKASRHVISVTGAGVRVQGDAARLQQVVTNLLDNAVKYTPPGGRVDIMVASEGSDAVLTVRDTGVGIRPDVLPRIFDLFVQGSDTMARSAGGLGLGLTLVKQLVALHGGSVSASSPGPNQGSEFVVRLPRIPDGLV
jgi:two-component system, sensor histidine kinase